MASTPPPLPSSDEGEFDDDDFGCFTSSVPVNVGLGSESEDDIEHDQGLTKQRTINADSGRNSHDDSIEQTPHSVARSDNEVNVTNVICNGEKLDSEQTEAPPVMKQLHETSHESNSEEKSNENSENQVSICPTEGFSENENMSSNAGVDLNTDSPSKTSTPIKLCDSRDCASGEEVNENSMDTLPSEVKESPSFDQETDDWADFSSAPSDFNAFSEDDQAQESTDNQDTFEPSEASAENKELKENHPAESTDCLDSHGETLDSYNSDNVITINESETHINDTCDTSNKEQESSCEIVEENANSRSDDDKSENQSVSDSNIDSNVVNECQSESDVLDSIKETKDCPDSLNIPPSTISDDDDDDFGDLSDFASHKAKDSVSKEENVAPISFRTSTCEDDDLEEGEDDHSDFGNKFDSHTETTEESPMPYGDEDDDEDWGFKAADNNSPQAKDNENDDFGDFGSSNQGPSDDADWANFSDSTTPKTAAALAAEETADFDEDEFQSPVSSKSAVTPSQQGLNRLEKAVSTSFPHDGQMYFHQPASINDKNNGKPSGEDCSPSSEDDSMNALESVVEMGLKTQPSTKQETWTITKELRIKDPMIGLWERLKDIDACHALDFGWTSSQCSQEVYSTLHIDTKNVLFSQKKQAVPFFASGLGILEPIRGGANQPEKQNTPPPQPLLDTSKPEAQKEPPQDIPPVDFDWSSSGLTDPLKVFKSDTFNSGLSSLEPFAEILQKSAAAGQGADKELSPEAVSILSKIPNLSFMQSKVLMFPIKDS